jgi:hypothetical protein
MTRRWNVSLRRLFRRSPARLPPPAETLRETKELDSKFGRGGQAVHPRSQPCCIPTLSRVRTTPHRVAPQMKALPRSEWRRHRGRPHSACRTRGHSCTPWCPRCQRGTSTRRARNRGCQLSRDHARGVPTCPFFVVALGAAPSRPSGLLRTIGAE